jgi:hypothetical protein
MRGPGDGPPPPLFSTIAQHQPSPPTNVPTTFTHPLRLPPAEALKKLGNEAFVAKNYPAAVAHYDAAIAACSTNHVGLPRCSIAVWYFVATTCRH